MKRYKVRWIVNDEVESSIHNTKKEAIKEYNKLFNMKYKYRNSLEVIRHNQIEDEYKTIITSLKSDSGGK